jgi:hypothetical protein
MARQIFSPLGIISVTIAATKKSAFEIDPNAKFVKEHTEIKK